MWSSFRLGVCVGARVTRTIVSQGSSRLRSEVPGVGVFDHVRSFSTPIAAPPSHNSDSTEGSDEVVEQLCGDDAELAKRLRILMLEVEVMRQDGRNAPNNLNTLQWKNLLELRTKSQRTSYLTFLFKNERAKENLKAKRQERKREYDLSPRKEKENADDMAYGLQDNAMFLRIRDSSINNFDNYRALQAMMHGQPIVMDCSYDDNMVPREATNAAKQLTFVFSDNRTHREPFDLHLCNANIKGRTMKQLALNIPTYREPWFPLQIHEESYTDIFPKQKLVYLTPHCRDELTEFDHEAVYIVGCMVDKTNNEPLSLAKAKRDGIRMAKLPLDRYLEWAPGSGKCLNINHMILILLDLKLTGDWKYALRHIPRRKLMETKIQAIQKDVTKFNPKFISTLKSTSNKTKFNSQDFRSRRPNIQSLFDENNKF